MYKKIMVPLDGSELAESVLPHVEAFIKKFNINDVILVRVLEKHPTEAVDLKTEEQSKASAKEYLTQVSERLKQEGTAVHPEVIVGRVAEGLVDYIGSNDIDLVIMASRGQSGITRWVMGSVADKVFRSAKVPVLMVRATEVKGEA